MKASMKNNTKVANKKQPRDEGPKPEPANASVALKAFFGSGASQAAVENFGSSAQSRAKLDACKVVSVHSANGKTRIKAVAGALKNNGAIDAIGQYMLTVKKIKGAPAPLSTVSEDEKTVKKAAVENGKNPPNQYTYQGLDDNAINGPTPLAVNVEHTMVSIGYADKFLHKETRQPRVGDVICFPKAHVTLGKPDAKTGEILDVYHNADQWQFVKEGEGDDLKFGTERTIDAFDGIFADEKYSAATAINVARGLGFASNEPHDADNNSPASQAVRFLISKAEESNSGVVSHLQSIKGRTDPKREHPNVGEMIDDMASYGETVSAEPHKLPFPVTLAQGPVAATVIHYGSLDNDVPLLVRQLTIPAKFEDFPQTFVIAKVESAHVTDYVVQIATTPFIVVDKAAARDAVEASDFSPLLNSSSGQKGLSPSPTLGAKFYLKGTISNEMSCSDIGALRSMVAAMPHFTFMCTYGVTPARQTEEPRFPNKLNNSLVVDLRRTVETIGVEVTSGFVEKYLVFAEYLGGRVVDDDNKADCRFFSLEHDGIANLSETHRKDKKFKQIVKGMTNIGKTMHYYVFDGELVDDFKANHESINSPDAGDAFVIADRMKAVAAGGEVEAFDPENDDHEGHIRGYLAAGTAIVYGIAK